MTELLVSAFLIGFLGSLHCVGMCGGLVTAMSMTRSRTWWPGLSIYQLGRLTTYSALGILAGLVGSVFNQGDVVSSAQSVMSILAGSLMIVFALYIAGWLPDPFARLSQRVSELTGLSRLIRTAATQDALLPWYSVGLVNGLLPCGLVYAALGLSLTATNIQQGASIMLAFGLGTLPAMLLVPAVMRAVTPQLRGNILKLGAVLLIILGLFTLVRGTSLGQHDHSQHHEPAAHTGHVEHVQSQPQDTIHHHHHDMSMDE